MAEAARPYCIQYMHSDGIEYVLGIISTILFQN